MDPTRLFAEVPSQVDFPELERSVLKFWNEQGLYEKSVQNRADAERFIFNDGPPFASGLPHYGHLLASIIKDVVPRYWTMRGFRVDRRFGWDCHGLPVENDAERQLGLKSRRDILDYGVAEFNEFCRGLVQRYTREWQEVIQRVGRWVDWSNQYRTMDPEFMESVWWVFKSLWDQDLLYEGYKSLAYCPHCATPLSNFEVNQGYQDTQDPSITIRFKLLDVPNTSLLAWTTTPWTLPSNTGLAIGRDIPYVKVTLKDQEQLIVAEALQSRVFSKIEDEVSAVEEQPVEELLGGSYEPLFEYFSDRSTEGAFRIVAADFVSTEDGTGIVHIAPGFGEDDYVLGQKEGLPALCPIDEDCRFTSEVPDFEGEFVKDTDTPIIRRLRASGQLFNEGSINHSYPFCWRCDSPLIYRAVTSWFVRMDPIKERLINANQQIWWIPEHIKDGRFGKWLEGARDWAISRNRYWGTPLPIWRNEETGEIVCLGSRADLERHCGQTVDDLHKHHVDQIELPSSTGRGSLRRVPEVLDCWFESGSMPYGQSHYPFDNKEQFDRNFPADFISEGLDQTRGWFYTLTVLAAALFDKPAFKNCIVSGMLLAEDGRKMSKRLQNYPEPTEMMDTYGADALRLYLLNSAVLKAEEMRLTETGIKESMRSVIIPLWNAYSFFVTYANIDHWSPAKGLGAEPAHLLDRWILSELQTLVHDINQEMEAYRLYRTVPCMVQFVEKLTNWYIRRSRRRFWKSEDDNDKMSAYATLYRVLMDLTKCLAPVLPFITETIYQNLVRTHGDDQPESVHLCDMPLADESRRDGRLESQMELTTRAVVLGRALRNKHNLKTRQPLRRLYLLPPDDNGRDKLVEMATLIADELNIKEVELVDDAAAFSDESFRPNFPALGPRFGKKMKEVTRRIQELTNEELTTLRSGKALEVAGGQVTLDDIDIQRRGKDDMVVTIDNNLGVGLDVHLDEDLVFECTAREFVNRVQNMRKDAGLQVSDRIKVGVRGDDELEEAIDLHSDYVAEETLSLEVLTGSVPSNALSQQDFEINGHEGSISIFRA